MKATSIISIICFQISLLLFGGNDAYAQKLPSVQEVTVHYSIDPNIEDSAKVPQLAFKAFNKATEIYYTLANSKINLYLIIRATDLQVAKKIIAGGITFGIHPNGKKVAKDKIEITYPVYDKHDRPALLSIREQEILSNQPLTREEKDSVVTSSDKKVRNFAKRIKVQGINTLDTLLSVYNEEGIKATSAIGQELSYTYALAVNLKLLGLNTTTHKSFTYHIRINDVEQNGINIQRDASGNIESINMSRGATRAQPATDFWGEYTLADK